jgi:hypothetical protein
MVQTEYTTPKGEVSGTLVRWECVYMIAMKQE